MLCLLLWHDIIVLFPQCLSVCTLQAIVIMDFCSYDERQQLTSVLYCKVYHDSSGS